MSAIRAGCAWQRCRAAIRQRSRGGRSRGHDGGGRGDRRDHRFRVESGRPGRRHRRGCRPSRRRDQRGQLVQRHAVATAASVRWRVPAVHVREGEPRAGPDELWWSAAGVQESVLRAAADLLGAADGLPAAELSAGELSAAELSAAELSAAELSAAGLSRRRIHRRRRVSGIAGGQSAGKRWQ